MGIGLLLGIQALSRVITGTPVVSCGNCKNFQGTAEDIFGKGEHSNDPANYVLYDKRCEKFESKLIG